MGAHAKLAQLKYTWFGYGAVVAVVELVRDGFDRTSMFEAALRVGLTAGIGWYLTKQLADKSSLVWAFGVVFGLIGAIVAGIDVVATLVDASEGHGFELARFLLSSAAAVVHVRTFRVLRDTEVRHHVML